MNQNPLSVQPCTLAKGKFNFAQAMRAGPWLFATGHLATDYKNGLAPSLADDCQPFRYTAKQEAEALFIFDRLRSLLEENGANTSNIVRLDQYYKDWRTVPHYHSARKKAFKDTLGIPASTSILQQELLYPDASLQVNLLAHCEPENETIEVLRPDGLPVSPHMGYAPVARVGDMLFLSGQMAEDKNDGIAAEARVPATHYWKGSAIRLETDYILRNKLTPALEVGGSSLEDVVKADIFLSNPNDIPAFNDVWAQWFPSSPPATTVIPCSNPGFNCVDASIEINLVAVRSNGSSKRQTISAPGVLPLFDNQSPAIRAGDLLLLSGLIACDEDGLIEAARPDSRQPFFNTSAETQMEHILDKAEALCQAAGTSLSNVVRIQQFHTDMMEFKPSLTVWKNRLGDNPLPISAVGIPNGLPIKDATILVDIWVYAP